MIHVKITKPVYERMRADLNRPHPFAFERVGFMFAKKDIAEDSVTLFATEYLSLPDEYYIDDPDVGARINSAALRRVMERAYSTKECILHVHLHDYDYSGRPRFSKVDRVGYNQMIPSFHNLGGSAVHGAMIFSRNNAAGLIWTSKTGSPVPVSKLSIVGYPLVIQEMGADFYV